MAGSRSAKRQRVVHGQPSQMVNPTMNQMMNPMMNQAMMGGGLGPMMMGANGMGMNPMAMNGMNGGMPVMQQPMPTMNPVQGGMMGMNPMMMNGQQQEMQGHNEEVASERQDGNSDTSDDDDHESSEFRRLQATVAAEYQQDDDALISRSTTMVRLIPRARLTDLIKSLCKDLDPALTADLTMGGMLTVLWLLCRLKPNTKISDLRALVCV